MDDLHRAVRALDQRVAGGAEQQTAESATATATDDDELGRFGPLEQIMPRSGQIHLAGDHDLGVFVLPPGQLRGEQSVRLSRYGGIGDGAGEPGESVEVQIAPRVHRDQARVAVPRFGESGADRDLAR